ncbi:MULTISPECIES: hypothetical protein [unclassified Xanthomonas]|uniref:hypothetical protein n=1 Tax=unclassified Xanthomonas TaxID=2643310 RepID=UPI00161618CB|nr:MULTISPECIES: hypothetical protein [unclassified Xanthomonas]MBB4129592.1 hypothetical protein [Xanthomonas sp. 3075]MBB5862464.1 hypothetical protein [Xanthomonas sp. 3058]
MNMSENGVTTGQGDNLEFIQSLERVLARDRDGKLLQPLAGMSFARPIYQVPVTEVAEPLRALVASIFRSTGVYDAVPESKHGENVHGSMRDVHQNDDRGRRYLPVLAYPASPLGRAGRYHDYILERGKACVQNRQRERSGTSDVLTGYVEYTVVLEGCSNVRLIFDYLNTRFFISPNHYKPWARAEALAARRNLGVDPARYRLAPHEAGMDAQSWRDDELYGPHLLIML